MIIKEKVQTKRTKRNHRGKPKTEDQNEELRQINKDLKEIIKEKKTKK